MSTPKLEDVKIEDETPLEFKGIPEIPKISDKQMDKILNLIKSMSSDQLNRYFTTCKGGKQINSDNDSFYRIDEDRYDQYVIKRKQKKLQKIIMEMEHKNENESKSKEQEKIYSLEKELDE